MTDAIEVYAAGSLAREGVDPRSRTNRVALVRARRGAYVGAEDWREAQPAERYYAIVRGTVDAMRSEAIVLSHHSAAVLWGLPALHWPKHVDVLVNRKQGSSGLIRRHQVSELPTLELREGVAVTGAARTVVDIARSSGFVEGLLAADAALGLQICTTSDLDAEVAKVSGNGIRAARAVVELADAGAESPGESLSRAVMYLAGLPQPKLQVPVSDAEGLIGWGDFGWDDDIGEFDGRSKYGLGAGAPADALWKEKLREDRMRRVGGVVRWTWVDADRRTPMLTRLAGAGIRPDADADAEWHRAPDADVPAKERRQRYFRDGRS